MRDQTKTSTRIGGSEIAAIFGVHDYLDEFGVWARKKGELPEQEATDRMRLGKHLEQGIIAYAAELEGWDTEWLDTTKVSDRYPYMVYTPDAVVREKRWGLDAKLVSWDQSYKWGKTANHIPDHAVMQAWWYMAGMDYERWIVVALVEGEYRPRLYPIERDPTAEAAMLKRAEAWWRRYLIGSERPPLTGSDTSARWVQQRYPRPLRANTVVQASPFEAALLDEYAAARRELARVDEARRTLEARIKEAIHTREGLKWPGGTFTWKLTKDSTKTAWKELAEVLLDQHPAAKALLEEFSEFKPGMRRMYFRSVEGEEAEL
jgi:predicted phage-related endonuclease